MASPYENRPLLVLTGTTASTKNQVGARLGERLVGEVISLDSMKVYRGMDLGTDKPSDELQGRVPHHLLDILTPLEGMNLKRYVEMAHEVRDDVRRRGRLPIIVGGTALYLNGFLKGVFDGPDANLEFRRGLSTQARILGVPLLHARLEAVDPLAAARIHPNDYKRIERALEVYALTGRPITAFQEQWSRRPAGAFRLFILTWPRTELDARIEARVDRMFHHGFLDEVNRVLTAGGFGRESSQALGYREAVQHLRGEITLREAQDLVKRRTKRFARRQLTWFRSMQEARWIEGAQGDDPDTLTAKVEQAYLTSI